MKTLADLTAPVEVVRVMLEKDLQAQCVDWWRRRGEHFWARKFSSVSQRSVPDYLFAVQDIGLYGKIKFATEFKKPGTRPKLIEKYGVIVMSTEAQYEEQLKMQAAGWYVFECDDFDMFKETVQRYLVSALA